VDRRALERVLAAELGRDCPGPIQFDQTIHDEQVGHALGAVIRSLWNDLSEYPVLQQWRVTRSLERNLLVAILGLMPHNYSADFLGGGTPAAPYYVKRAEEYIRENVRNVIKIEHLVAVSGVSSRSLYYGFRRWRGTTPMSYLRNLRLSLAHEELKLARSTGNNVTRIALSVGYDHLSRFSKDYRQRFGESPSVTMLQGN
jgi:AraC-like DNA-binding protein